MSSKQQYLKKNPDDVVVVAAYRTALTKGGRGGFKDVGSDFLLKKLTEEFVKKLVLTLKSFKMLPLVMS